MDHNSIQCQNIEKLAKLGYWEWWPISQEATLSSGFIKLFSFVGQIVSPASILHYLKTNYLNREYIELINYLQNLKKGTFPGIKIFSIPMPDKSTKFFEANACLSTSNGTQYIAGTLQEVTDRVKYNILKEKELVFEKKISEIASRFINESDFELSIHTTLNELGELCNAEQVELLKIENDLLFEEYQWKNSNNQSSCFNKNIIPSTELKYFIDLLKENKLVYYQNIFDFPDRMPLIKSKLIKGNTNSLIIAGIQKDKQTIGALVISRNIKFDKWDFSDIHMVKMTSLILSNGLKQNLMHKSLRESEKRLKFALLAGNLGTYEFDLKLQTRFYDERCATIFGYSCTTLNKLTNWIHTNIDFAHYEAYMLNILQCIEGEKHFFELEYKIKCKDGSYKWVSDLGIVTELNNDGEPLKMVGVIQDISNRKSTEEALIIAKEKAEENEKLKTSFLANVSHEIRTPMNGISGFAELLYNNMVSENDKHHYLEIIWKNSNRLLALINNILDISKLETKQLILFEKECSINEISQDILRRFETKIQQNKDIEFRIISNFDTENFTFQTDDTRFKQVLINLIDNAFKFTNNGLIEVNFEINTTGNLQVCVKDSGTGIPREFQSQLFNRFSQSEHTIQQNLGGTGLGLPISKGLVEVLGGCIWVKSLKGIGTTFYFTIPIKKALVTDKKINL